MDNRGKGNVMNVIITTENGIQFVSWTCPKSEDGKPCLTRNKQRWYGRADHYCIGCEQTTNIKGESHPIKLAGVLV